MFDKSVVLFQHAGRYFLKAHPISIIIMIIIMIIMIMIIIMIITVKIYIK